MTATDDRLRRLETETSDLRRMLTSVVRGSIPAPSVAIGGGTGDPVAVEFLVGIGEAGAVPRIGYDMDIGRFVISHDGATEHQLGVPAVVYCWQGERTLRALTTTPAILAPWVLHGIDRLGFTPGWTELAVCYSAIASAGTLSVRVRNTADNTTVGEVTDLDADAAAPATVRRGSAVYLGTWPADATGTIEIQGAHSTGLVAAQLTLHALHLWAGP